LCLLFIIISDDAIHTKDSAVVGLQTNNTLIAYNTSFKKRELNELQKAAFLAKPTQQLTADNNLTFNGA
jgi:hypothetical protein